MAKLSILEITQDILNDMDSDEVNSIDDTFEATQVAQIIGSTFRDMMANRDWSHQRKLTKFDSSASSLLPVVLPVASNTKRIDSIKYDKIRMGETRKNYLDVDYATPDDFLRLSNQRNNSNTNIDVMSYNGVELLIQNDKAPAYYTSFNETEVLFDSYDSAVDDTIKSSKTQLVAYFIPPLVIADDNVPDLPEEAFSALINEAKSRAMLKLKQFSDDKAEIQSRKQNAWLANNEWTVKGGIGYANYGRTSRKMGKDPTFRRD